MEEKQFDLIIIGSGPAGLSASIYASCYHMKHIVIGSIPGGQMQLATHVLNYPGFEDITGRELTERMVGQARKRGGEIINDTVIKISNFKFQISNEIPNSENSYAFEIDTINGKRFKTKSIILATGMERRKLNIPGEKEYTGKGVHYCATCGRQDYEGKVCAVVGGGNSAVQAAVELAAAAKKVYVIYRGTELRGDAVWLEKIKAGGNIEVLFGTEVKKIIGTESIRSLELEFSDPSLPAAAKKGEIAADRIFIEIGGVPGTALVIPLGVETDEKGFIKVNEKLETNIPGIFAAGDLVSGGRRIEQIATAVGLGARSAFSAFECISGGRAGSAWGKTVIKR